VNTTMVIGPPTNPVLHKVQVGTATYLFTCNYSNSIDDGALERYWIFKAGEPATSWGPTDAGTVNLSTNLSNLTTAYPFTFSLGALGKNLTLSNLVENQTGRYWCVSFNYDYQKAASWDLGVFVVSNYLVESIVLLVINAVLFLVFIFCSVYTYWKNRRYVVRHKLLDAANSSTEHAADTVETVPRA
jgi:hypothetical protein